jgi:chromosome segregation ATPase
MEGAMSILLNSIKSLNDDIQRMNRELSGYQYSISVLAQQVSSLKTLVQELNDYILGIEINQNLLYQQLLSLKEYVENFQATSFDGTLTWKIKNFQEKRSM